MCESIVHGLAINQNKPELFAVAGVGAIIVDVALAIAGKGTALVGTLSGDVCPSPFKD